MLAITAPNLAISRNFGRQARAKAVARAGEIKVPQITALFWVTKIVSTAMGEAVSDFLDGGNGIYPYAGVLLAFVVLVFALWRQFRAPRYQPITYWFSVGMVAVFGTMAADILHKIIGVPYWASSALYAVALIVIFSYWYRTEHSLSIHTVKSRRREIYYWATVLATFALGTAVGDLTAASFHLGYLVSGLLFTVVIAVPLLGYKLSSLSRVFLFWFAYIVTRPLGASFADWLDVSHHRGGVGLGTGPIGLALILLMIALVSYLNKSGLSQHD